MSVGTVSDRILLAVYDWVEDGNDETGISIADLTGTVRDGKQLSQQVEITLAIERLVENGSLEHRTESREQLVVTDEGRGRAAETAAEFATRTVEVVEDSTRAETTLQALAERTESGLAAVATSCSEDGIYYADSSLDSSLVNREDELDKLRTIVENCRETQTGEAAFLHGPSGIGKTTIVESFLETVDVEATVDRCQGQGSEPYQPIRGLLDKIDSDDPFTTTAVDVRDGGAYEAQQQALFHEVTDALTPSDGIRIVFLDDLHAADAASWEYLGYLLERLPELPLVLVGCYLPGALPEEAPVGTDTEFEDSPVTQIALDGFDTSETKRLIEHVLNERGAPASLAETVQQYTDGTPLLVASTVETLVDSDQLDPSYRWYPESTGDLDLSEELSTVVARQFDTLDVPARELLEWVALHEEGAVLSVLEEVCPIPSFRIGAIVELLVEMNILVRDGERVSVRSKIIRETVLESLENDQRTQQHLAIAQALVGQLEDASPDSWASIAIHYERAGQHVEAIEYHERAARSATDLYAHEVALDHYERALTLAREHQPERVFDILEAMGQRHYTLGEYETALRRYQYVAEQAEDTDRSRHCHYRCGEIEATRGNYEEALELVEEGLGMRENVDDVTRCKLINRKAYAMMQMGEIEEAVETFQQQQELAEALGEDEQIASAIADLGVLWAKRGDLDRAENLLERAVTLREELDDPKAVVDSLNNLGLVQWKAGRLTEAARTLEKCYNRQEELGYRVAQSATMTNLGVIAIARDELDEATEWYERSLELNRKLDDRQGIAILQGNLAAVYLQRGDLEQAWERTEQAEEIAREIGDRSNLTVVYNIRSKISRYRGDLESALEDARAGAEIASEIDDRERLASALASQGRVHLERDVYDHALDAFREGFNVADEGGLDKQARENRAGLIETLVERDEVDSASEYVDEIDEDDLLLEERLALARYRWATGGREEATTLLESELDAIDTGTRPIAAARLYSRLARFSAESGADDRARRHAGNCRNLANATGTTLFLERCRPYLDEPAG